MGGFSCIRRLKIEDATESDRTLAGSPGVPIGYTVAKWEPVHFSTNEKKGGAMKKIGLIGGMSWESTAEYYRIINQRINEKMGKFHSANILMNSVDFQQIEELQHKGNWDGLTDIMVGIARRLEESGAELMVICTNTMHETADEVEANINVPFIHIADTVANVITRKGLNVVGLLGTKFTMNRDFYKRRLHDRFGIRVIVPGQSDVETVHRIIYEELVHGSFNGPSRNIYGEIIERLAGMGAEGIILGCTEIPLLMRNSDCSVPLFDTLRIHAEAAADFALK